MIERKHLVHQINYMENYKNKKFRYLMDIAREVQCEYNLDEMDEGQDNDLIHEIIDLRMAMGLIALGMKKGDFKYVAGGLLNLEQCYEKMAEHYIKRIDCLPHDIYLN